MIQSRKRIFSLIIALVLCLGVMLTVVACADREPFTVFFNGNGGTLVSGNETQEVKSASELVAPVYERENYKFVGWDVELSKINKHTTVNALWVERQFLTFDYATETTLIVYPGFPIGELPIPAIDNEGKDFECWAVESQRIDSDSEWIWFSNKQAKAVWLGDGEYMLELRYEGGTVETPNPLTYSTTDETFSIINPTRKGYDFLGWVEADNLTATPQKNVMVESGSSGRKSFIAKWQPKQYTITLDAKSGSLENNSLTVTYDSKIGKLPIPENGAITFLGWYYNDEKVESLDVYTYDENIELVAKWQYTITFQLWSYANKDTRVDVSIIGGAPEDKIVDSDYVINSEFPPKNMVQLLKVNTSEFTFYGWTVNDKKFDGTEHAYPSTTTVEELMEKLKNGSDTDRAIRNEIVNTGIITIVARTRSEYTGNH